MAKRRKNQWKALRQRVRRLIRTKGSDVLIGLVTGIVTNLITNRLDKNK